LRQYTIEYADHYPFGFTFNKFSPTTGRPAASDTSYIAWFSSIDKYLTTGTNEIVLLDANSGFFDGATSRNFNAAFRCPSVPSIYQQQIHYYQHAVVMPHMPGELPAQFRSGPAIGPAKVNQLYPNTALIWDTPVLSSGTPVTPSMFWISSGETVSGFTLPRTKIDNQQLSTPAATELRFRGPSADRFSISTNALKNPAGPIYWPSDAFLQSLNSQVPSYNADATGVILTNMIGSARFRHTGLGCNVLFADGSVRTLYLHPWRKVAAGPVGTGSADYIDSDFRRNMLMTKWPPGFVDSNTVPTN
jgi:prepilin-type processing-associated H-X9-DG protein